MTPILDGWTVERINALAPDASVAKDGQKLALGKNWVTAGHNEVAIWGECQGSGTKPYQVKIDLTRWEQGETTALSCSCPSRKIPCKHVIGLLLRFQALPDSIPPSEPPAYLTAWLAKRAATDVKKEVAKAPTSAKTLAQRQKQIAAGLEDLERWLNNLIRHGLADPQISRYEFWEGMARRMADAKANGLRNWLTSLGGISASGAGWETRLLQELGALHLVIQGFKRFDSLPPEMQADLRAVLSWDFKKEDLFANYPTLSDQWLVLGVREGVSETDAKIRYQRLWLYGHQTQHPALILEFAFGTTAFPLALNAGGQIEAEVVYYPSQAPLRAVIQAAKPAPKTKLNHPFTSLTDTITTYQTARALNPWLRQYPFALAQVLPLSHQNQMVVADTDGQYLPLAPAFQAPWSLMAMSGGKPLDLFGEWDGHHFYPLSVYLEAHWTDLATLPSLT